MSPEVRDSLADYIERRAQTEATLLVLNRTDPVQFLNLLEQAFERQPVSVVERTVPGATENLVVLFDETGVVAESSLQDLAHSYLLINADRYRTGPNDLSEAAVPAVLRELRDIPFHLRGYPESLKEKLLLIAMSRYVEARALRVDEGALHVGFQRLSRIEDELGTRRVYERLADSGVETHVYGVGDATDLPADLVVHADDGTEFRRSWFLVLEAPAEADAVALVAVETGTNVWRGTWSFDPGLTADVAEYVRQTLARA